MSTLKTNTITAVGGAGTITVPSNNVLYAPGHVVQVQVASSGPGIQTITSATPLAVTGLSINFTPISATSRILVQVQISSNLVHVSSFGIYKDGAATVSTAGYTNNNQADMQVTTYIGSDINSTLWCIPVMWSEIAGSTTARTYAVYGTASWSPSVYGLTINNRPGNDMASFSYMTVMEIAQ